MNPYFTDFFRAFLLTFLIEYLALSLLVRGAKPPKTLGATLLANSISLPIVWFITPSISGNSLTYVLTSELLAIASESLVLRWFLPITYRRSLLASLCMNTASFIVGWLLP